MRLHCKELALQTGRKWQSVQTGFVHYCYHSSTYDTIPTKENAYFALALFRSRISENIQEAKQILDRLLSYQVEGNFPIYLHEFPTCYSRWQAAEILPSLYWILKTFHLVLGKDLKDKVEVCLNELIYFSLNMLEENVAEYPIRLRIACGANALGKLFDKTELEQKGSELLSSIRQQKEQRSWYTSEIMGSMLASLNMAEMWPEFWQHCREYFNEQTATYCGPWFNEHLRGKFPQATLFDLYLIKTLPKRCQQLHPSLLYAALVHPFTCEEASGTIQDQNQWDRVSTSQLACCIVEQKEILNSVEKRGFQPFVIQFGDCDHPASFVVQGGNVQEMTYQIKDQQIELLFTLGSESENDNPVENREVSFFCTQEGTRILLNGKGTTVFRLGDSLNLSGDLNLSMAFELVEGKGDFLGHVAIGNRPSQLEGGKRDLGDAYDWHLFLRSLRRTPNCKVRVTIAYA